MASSPGGDGAKASSPRKSRPQGKIPSKVPEIKERGLTKLEKKLQAARKAFYRRLGLGDGSRPVSPGTIQRMLAQMERRQASLARSVDTSAVSAGSRPSSRGPLLEGRNSAMTNPLDSPRGDLYSDGPLGGARRGAAGGGAGKTSAAAGGAGAAGGADMNLPPGRRGRSSPHMTMHLSILPTATHQWQQDKTLYYTPVASTSALTPAQFPRTLREGMLMYFSPMEKAISLEAWDRRGRRLQQQDEEDASAWRAALSEALLSHQPGVAAAAGQVEALGTEGEAHPDPVMARVTELAARLQVHPEVLWGLLEQEMEITLGGPRGGHTSEAGTADVTYPSLATAEEAQPPAADGGSGGGASIGSLRQQAAAGPVPAHWSASRRQREASLSGGVVQKEQSHTSLRGERSQTRRSVSIIGQEDLKAQGSASQLRAEVSFQGLARQSGGLTPQMSAADVSRQPRQSSTGAAAAGLHDSAAAGGESQSATAETLPTAAAPQDASTQAADASTAAEHTGAAGGAVSDGYAGAGPAGHPATSSLPSLTLSRRRTMPRKVRRRWARRHSLSDPEGGFYETPAGLVGPHGTPPAGPDSRRPTHIEHPPGTEGTLISALLKRRDSSPHIEKQLDHHGVRGQMLIESALARSRHGHSTLTGTPIANPSTALEGLLPTLVEPRPPARRAALDARAAAAAAPGPDGEPPAPLTNFPLPLDRVPPRLAPWEHPWLWEVSGLPVPRPPPGNGAQKVPGQTPGGPPRLKPLAAATASAAGCTSGSAASPTAQLGDSPSVARNSAGAMTRGSTGSKPWTPTTYVEGPKGSLVMGTGLGPVVPPGSATIGAEGLTRSDLQGAITAGLEHALSRPGTAGMEGVAGAAPEISGSPAKPQSLLKVGHSVPGLGAAAAASGDGGHQGEVSTEVHGLAPGAVPAAASEQQQQRLQGKEEEAIGAATATAAGGGSPRLNWSPSTSPRRLGSPSKQQQQQQQPRDGSPLARSRLPPFSPDGQALSSRYFDAALRDQWHPHAAGGVRPDMGQPWDYQVGIMNMELGRRLAHSAAEAIRQADIERRMANLPTSPVRGNSPSVVARGASRQAEAPAGEAGGSTTQAAAVPGRHADKALKRVRTMAGPDAPGEAQGAGTAGHVGGTTLSRPASRVSRPQTAKSVSGRPLSQAAKQRSMSARSHGGPMQRPTTARSVASSRWGLSEYGAGCSPEESDDDSPSAPPTDYNHLRASLASHIMRHQHVERHERAAAAAAGGAHGSRSRSHSPTRAASPSTAGLLQHGRSHTVTPTGATTSATAAGKQHPAGVAAGPVSTPPPSKSPEQDTTTTKAAHPASPMLRATAVDSAAAEAKAALEGAGDLGDRQQQQQEGSGQDSGTKPEPKLEVLEAVQELATVAVQEIEATRAEVKEGVRQRYNQAAGVIGSTSEGAGSTYGALGDGGGVPITRSFWAASAGAWGMPIEEEAASEASSDWLGSDVLLEWDRVVLVPQKAVGILAAGASRASGTKGAAQVLLDRHRLQSAAGARPAGGTLDGQEQTAFHSPLLRPTASVGTGVHQQQSADGTHPGNADALYSTNSTDPQHTGDLALSSGLLASPLLSHELRKLRGVARGSLASRVQQQRRSVSMNAAMTESGLLSQGPAGGSGGTNSKVSPVGRVPATTGGSHAAGPNASPMLSPHGGTAKAAGGTGARGTAVSPLGADGRPLKTWTPPRPLLTFSSDLGDTRKMVTELNNARQVKNSLWMAEKQLTPLSHRRRVKQGAGVL